MIDFVKVKLNLKFTDKCYIYHNFYQFLITFRSIIEVM